MIVLQGESRSAVIPKQNQSAHETRFGKKVFRGDRPGTETPCVRADLQGSGIRFIDRIRLLSDMKDLTSVKYWA